MSDRFWPSQQSWPVLAEKFEVKYNGEVLSYRSVIQAISDGYADENILAEIEDTIENNFILVRSKLIES